MRGWFARLAPDVRLVIRDVDLETHGLGRPAVRIDHLDAELLAEDDGWFRLRGNGEPSGEGSLEWNVRVSPEELRGEGHANFEGISLALVAPLLPDMPWYEADRARVSGHLRMAAESTARISLEGDIALTDAAVSSPRIAPVPVFDINLAADGSAYFMPLERRLEVTRATLKVGEAELRVGGSLELGTDHYAVDVRASMNATPCDTVLRAVPEDLLGELRGFSFSGDIGGVASLRIDSRDLDATALRVEVSDGCTFLSVPGLADLRRVQVPFRHEVQEPNGEVFSMTTGPGTANWVSIHAMSPYFIHAVLAHEDSGFFNHSGFSILSVERALVRNLREGRFVLGASTISMQLAKNLFLNREKTLARKVQEALLTWWLETAMTKKKLLELYLNIIEYGPSVYGVRHAARHYFGRDADELSPAEGAFLATVLPAPRRMHNQYTQGRLGPVTRTAWPACSATWPSAGASIKPRSTTASTSSRAFASAAVAARPSTATSPAAPGACPSPRWSPATKTGTAGKRPVRRRAAGATRTTSATIDHTADSPCCKALWAPRTEVRGSIPGLDQWRKSAP
jgi:hypothetical protein